MSGGHWNYAGLRVREMLEEIAQDEAMLARFPRLALVFGELAEVVYEVEHEIDWDFCGDRMIVHDRVFETQSLEKLETAAGAGRRDG